MFHTITVAKRPPIAYNIFRGASKADVWLLILWDLPLVVHSLGLLYNDPLVIFSELVVIWSKIQAQNGSMALCFKITLFIVDWFFVGDLNYFFYSLNLMEFITIWRPFSFGENTFLCSFFSSTKIRKSHGVLIHLEVFQHRLRWKKHHDPWHWHWMCGGPGVHHDPLRRRFFVGFFWLRLWWFNSRYPWVRGECGWMVELNCA